MTSSLSSSLIRSLNALRHQAIVIDNHGIILFTSDSWNDYIRRFGLCSITDWAGASSLDLFQELLSAPSLIASFSDALQDIFQGESLIASTEFIRQTPLKGSRLFCMHACPLICDQPAAEGAIVLSLQDCGPAPTSRHIQPVRTRQPLRLRQQPHSLVPICASCKSIRNSSEEWITIERYLQQQLSLQFTHDICPDCIRQLYPQYAGAFKQ